MGANMGSRIRRAEVSLKQKKGNWYKNEAVLGKDLGPSAQGRGWCEHSRIEVSVENQKQKVRAKLQVRTSQKRCSQAQMQ